MVLHKILTIQLRIKAHAEVKVHWNLCENVRLNTYSTLLCTRPTQPFIPTGSVRSIPGIYMDYGVETIKNGRLWLCMSGWLQAKVRVCRLGLRRRLNASPVCDAQRHWDGICCMWRYVLNFYLYEIRSLARRLNLSCCITNSLWSSIGSKTLNISMLVYSGMSSQFSCTRQSQIITNDSQKCCSLNSSIRIHSQCQNYCKLQHYRQCFVNYFPHDYVRHIPASKMTHTVSSGALNCTHSPLFIVLGVKIISTHFLNRLVSDC